MTPPPPPSRSHAQLLMEFLEERDEPCPRCGYNLRGLKGVRCPECGQLLSFSIGAREPSQTVFLWGVVILACGLGFLTISASLIVLLWLQRGLNGTGDLAVAGCLSIGAALMALLTLGWIGGRHRIVSAPRQKQIWWVFGAAWIVALEVGILLLLMR